MRRISAILVAAAFFLGFSAVTSALAQKGGSNRTEGGGVMGGSQHERMEHMPASGSMHRETLRNLSRTMDQMQETMERMESGGK
jgi:hypothetical protein